MKLHMLMVWSMFVYMSMFVGVAAADGGAGVCVAGTGASFTAAEAPAFVGVNAGTNSETGAFQDQGAYEAQCCAETGSPPDCFEPVEPGA